MGSPGRMAAFSDKSRHWQLGNGAGHLSDQGQWRDHKPSPLSQMVPKMSFSPGLLKNRGTGPALRAADRPVSRTPWSS